MTDWQTGYAASGGERIYWESAGKGVPIVLCHGAGSNHVSLYQQVAAFASDHHQVVVWDQRGYGNSTLETGIFGIATATSDLTAVLQAAGLGDARVHVVGQALGGLVAAAWAVRNPERTVTLALCDGPLALIDEGRRLGWTLEPNDKGVQATLVDRQLGQTVAVGRLFEERDAVGTSATRSRRTARYSPQRRPNPCRWLTLWRSTSPSFSCGGSTTTSPMRRRTTWWPSGFHAPRS
jgi:pimeloyl-ACP methyl ester carboxylesterase